MGLMYAETVLNSEVHFRQSSIHAVCVLSIIAHVHVLVRICKCI